MRKMYEWLYSTIGSITEQVGIIGLTIILLTLWAIVSMLAEGNMKRKYRNAKKKKPRVIPRRGRLHW